MTSKIDKLKHFYAENYHDTNFTDDLNDGEEFLFYVNMLKINILKFVLIVYLTIIFVTVFYVILLFLK